jgi:hypothetical protein
MIDCFAYSDGAMCECKCKDFHDNPDSLDDDGFMEGCKWAGEDIAEKTLTEIIDLLFLNDKEGLCVKDKLVDNKCKTAAKSD